ncbi:MAG: hypothetical protein A2Z31_08135 [candidate division NC10 bacterium RBG_16_65_8]|nr:MAG: hypothetical protein A2Z31_08135 [candidate division NC10 bacterium RBG_16_65_8]
MVRVVLVVDEDEVRPNFPDDALDALDALAVQRDRGVRILPPEELRDLKDLRRLLLFSAADRPVAASVPFGHDEQEHLVALPRILDEGSAAA